MKTMSLTFGNLYGVCDNMDLKKSIDVSVFHPDDSVDCYCGYPLDLMREHSFLLDLPVCRFRMDSCGNSFFVSLYSED